MKTGTRGKIALSVLCATLTLFGVAITSITANAAPARAVTFYTDPTTGQVFTRQCRRCLKLGDYVPAGTTQEIEQRIEQKTQAQLEQDRAALRAEQEQRMLQQQQWNAEMAKQVSEIQPFAREFGDRWYKKISVGTLVFADYRYFTHTGFGTALLDTPQQLPGPGNNGFNAFDISRAYLDFKFTPDENFLFRVTPDIYSTIGTASADSIGKNSAYASQLDGNLGFRLKYAYLDYNTFYKKVLPVTAMAEDKFTIGQEPNPLVDWEEGLYGFRYVNLIPWNFLSLSSTQLGFSMKGPIKFNEKQYVDYDVGVFNDANFHQVEQSAYKQVMGRVSAYPFGAKSRFQGLGLTGFYNYGYSNRAPDLNGGPNNAGRTAHLTRIAALLHYTAETWGIAGEFDYGHNAFSSGNLLSGSAPIDEFSTPATPTGFGPWASMVKGLQDNGQAVQEGWDFFGHYDIPHTPFTLFGMFEQILPNARAKVNPLDFYRYIAGIQYLYSKNLRFALDSQNISYYHDQFTFPGAELKTLSGRNGTVADTAFAVPRDTHAFFLNIEFRY
jgi:hypothetical protein